ncbi:flagellar hook-basal body protein FliE [Burkholderia pseudomallei]|uniref:flagellar hook-basal body protein FliE n=1 Tax=Burkholderia pseudomallei TaxID=28450 RepID=UPI00050FCCAB|nr:flagellar hook-basal body protein FliE [Burkholderia pseudomallei]KGC72000.1 putative flagellar hook-basal body complex protein [Burkholderia pseudomallei]
MIWKFQRIDIFEIKFHYADSTIAFVDPERIVSRRAICVELSARWRGAMSCPTWWTG